MIPQNQTEFGEHVGNCFAACLASIIERSLRDVPNFCVEFPRARWMQEVQRWLDRRGFGLVSINFKSRLDFEQSLNVGTFTTGHYIISGPSPPGAWLHSCVGRMGTIVHDPHPDGEGIEQDDWGQVAIEVVTVR